MIDIENLQLHIGDKEILRGIDLHLQAGDIYGLLGPNGAGKSSTIFSLLGLRQRSSGQVRVLGYDPDKEAAAIRHTVGVLPEQAGFYEWMSAPDYLRWYSRLYSQTASERDHEELLKKVGLGYETGRPIGTFSRGMKQRLAMARALISQPKLLLLDEPTNGLDPRGRREIHDLLLESVEGNHTGVLLCTHLLDDVDRLCNRISIIDQGKTLLEGTLNELLARESSQCFRLRLETEPDSTALPESLSLLGREGDWWHLQIPSSSSQSAAEYWPELWRRGWRILEIRAETTNLEEFYMNRIGRDSALSA